MSTDSSIASNGTKLVERLTSEGLIGMQAAARCYGQAHDGKPPHASTPTRHVLNGVRLRNGRLVKLEAIRIAGRIMTSRAAVLRFFAAQNEPEPAEITSPDSPPTPRQVANKRSAASTALDALIGVA